MRKIKRLCYSFKIAFGALCSEKREIKFLLYVAPFLTALLFAAAVYLSGALGWGYPGGEGAAGYLTAFLPFLIAAVAFSAPFSLRPSCAAESKSNSYYYLFKAGHGAGEIVFGKILAGWLLCLLGLFGGLITAVVSAAYLFGLGFSVKITLLLAGLAAAFCLLYSAVITLSSQVNARLWARLFYAFLFSAAFAAAAVILGVDQSAALAPLPLVTFSGACVLFTAVLGAACSVSIKRAAAGKLRVKRRRVMKAAEEPS